MTFFLCYFISHQQATASSLVDSLQIDSSLIVDQILITGNDVTKDFVILREMSLLPGKTITEEKLEYDKNRIYSLGLFNQVALQVVPTEKAKAILVVNVSERWYIYPYPIFGIKDQDWGKLYYGLGLIHLNFRGRNEKLSISGAVGYDPWISLGYRNPFLSEDGKYFFDARLVYNSVRNKSLQAQPADSNFDERHFSLSSTLGKRFGTEHTAWILLGFELVHIDPRTPRPTISADGTDTYPLASIGYAYDTRDLAEYPNQGTLVRIQITKFGFPSHDYDVTRYGIDLRRFQPLPSSFVLCGRVFTNLLSGSATPTYNRTFLGYDERIRGHFRETREGEMIFGSTIELHYPIFPAKFFTVDFVPSQFSVWRFGVTAAIFANAGTVWFQEDPIPLKDFSKGYGIGLHFLLPYSSVLRTEYAWNESRTGEFILGFGAAF